jgi:hypothetical protein
MNKSIERPYENFYCGKCTFCTSNDMCMSYKLGMSYAYCPRIVVCEKFKKREEEWQRD